ncbi:MAG: hypothetical protein ACD_42C00232G0003 [uncultured bacterium]|nr:MAG: hypothetical protein ACD_42C00232G0003 [uncultured bacterium]OGT33375.1 MAG: hypothetical protein A3C44_04085 [Gammaproteobacteria bacterium RIFCSPHIGHO2_02_FULL_39_13]OGT50316.1 MAG: hypothetical protein A3E53_01010 [Gammaproteobacteria bacterium RIFCSPHIGHO2_12_FULL_39_24]
MKPESTAHHGDECDCGCRNAKNPKSASELFSEDSVEIERSIAAQKRMEVLKKQTDGMWSHPFPEADEPINTHNYFDTSAAIFRLSQKNKPNNFDPATEERERKKNAPQSKL